MKTTTLNSASDEGIAFEIPQLDAAPLTERAPASAAGSAGAFDVPRRSQAASLSKSLTELQCRLDQAEAGALKAEEQLTAHQRHCICRAESVAEFIACEGADGDAAPQGSTR